jgi:hypothetical protein
MAADAAAAAVVRSQVNAAGGAAVAAAYECPAVPRDDDAAAADEQDRHAAAACIVAFHLLPLDPDGFQSCTGLKNVEFRRLAACYWQFRPGGGFQHQDLVVMASSTLGHRFDRSTVHAFGSKAAKAAYDDV